MSKLRLIIGNKVLADSSRDGVTCWLKADKPSLNLRNDSMGIVGMRYARNIPRASGMSLEFTATIGRVFANYAAAERFVLSHLSELAAGAGGILKIETGIGVLYGFKNAVLGSVNVSGEIGKSTEIEYSFVCGEPISEFESLIVINGSILKIGDYYPVAKIKG